MAIAEHEGDKWKSGTPDEVVDALDPRTLKTLTYEAAKEQYGGRCEIRLGLSKGFGVTLDLHDVNQDTGWLPHAMTSLDNEIRSGVPWWSIARRTLFQNIYLITLGTLGLVVEVLANPNGSGWAPIVGLAIGYIVALASGFLLLRNLPMLEIVHPGGASRGRRVLGALGAVALNLVTVAIGIIYSAAHSVPKK